MANKIATINTSSATGNFPSANGQGFGGNARTLAFQGTFASGTIKISASYDGGTTFITLTDSDGSDVSITSDSIVNISLGTGVKIRYDVSGVSGTMDVDVFMA